MRRLQPLGSPWILTAESLKTLTEIHLRQSGLKARLLCEPMAKNTAAAVAFLCQALELEGHGDQVVGLFPADHLVERVEDFQTAIRFAEQLAAKGKVVTLGIRPDRPETGFGYIQTADVEESRQEGKLNLEARRVSRFHEKPDLATAEAFLRQGGFSWNAGIFVFKVSQLTAHFQKWAPAIWGPMSQLAQDHSNLKEIYSKIPSVSLDVAVMEKLGGTGDLLCLPVEIGWNDVGSWDAVAEESFRRKVKPQGPEPISVSAKDNFVLNTTGKRIALVGVEGLQVIDTGDVLLIAKQGQSQDVRKVVETLSREGSPLLQDHSHEDRPWGRFEILRDTDRFKSKVITVHPGAQISYQSHSKREEHWILTAGSGEVVLNDEVIPVKAGQHIHIPIGAKHRIRNTGSQTLEFVEVQLGTYFGEDDIVRYQDDYKRI